MPKQHSIRLTKTGANLVVLLYYLLFFLCPVGLQHINNNYQNIVMKNVTPAHRSLRRIINLTAVVLVLSSCHKLAEYIPGKEHPKQDLGNLKQINLVSNNTNYGAGRTDPKLLNAWGISFSTTGTPWISSTGGGVTTIYDREGKEVLAPVNIPSPAGSTGGTPTGTVFNGSSSDFILSNGQAARFMFVNLDGVISGWNGPAGANAVVIKNNVGQAVYTGVALATDNGQQYLYAANALKGTIDVFDRTFVQVTTMKFNDPYLAPGYVPFNIRFVGGQLYVAYTKVTPDGRALKAAGNGVVNIFSSGGKLLKRFAEGGHLNAPWGFEVAPPGFFAGKDAQAAILVGNFGDGRINAYTPDGRFIDQLKVAGKTVEIEGLWEISFAPSTSTIDPNRLYFAAGPDDEKDGLFGYLIK
ncbi:MAG: TIGR03118 family protein [Sphingobacteriales bacterium]|nr:MAG: TIGR03118 family protein [Sphingobacteriales bacterium]